MEKIISQLPPHKTEPTVTVNFLTKREYFAALAMQGLLAKGVYYPQATYEAAEAADALINALNK